MVFRERSAYFAFVPIQITYVWSLMVGRVSDRDRMVVDVGLGFTITFPAVNRCV